MVKEPTYHERGYWAVLLGASSGIGLAVAHQLASEGINLCVVHRDRRARVRELEPEWETMREHGVRVLTFNADAIEFASMQQILDEFSEALGEGEKIRLLMHAVARGNLKSLYESNNPQLATDDFVLTLDAMALSWHRWTMACMERGLFADSARNIGLTSEGSTRAWKGYGAVAAAKSTLESLGRQMALELAPTGLRTNVLQPGVTDTPSLRMIPGSAEMMEAAQRRNPLGRLTRPNDVAQVVSLLCRDEADWINGAIIPVDGGESISA
ncbi:MAG: SDR family oxidoreductase [Cryomorphaceae bacterium]|nr:MAG: SDR family oxidoreductase [Cryomorphaceae bacterium]